MREDDRDLVALFAEETPPTPDPAFVARVAGEVGRARRRRVAFMSAAGLALGLGGAAALALIAPLLGEAGTAIAPFLATPAAAWTAAAAGLALAIGVPLWQSR